MESLISNTLFGSYLKSKNISDLEYRKLRDNYDLFLTQSLEIYQFVPCKIVDGVWVVLEEPKFRDTLNSDAHFLATEEYQQAKKKCLFEDFEMDNSFVTHKSHNSFFYPISCLHEQTIEDLIKYNLELTKTAQKQIGL